MDKIQEVQEVISQPKFLNLSVILTTIVHGAHCPKTSRIPQMLSEPPFSLLSSLP